MPRANLPRVRTRRAWPIKELLLLLHLGLAWPVISERIGSLGVSASLVLYAGLFGLLAMALWLASRIRQGWVRWPLALLLFVSAGFMAANERITGQHFGYESFLNMLGAAGFIGDAVAQHGVRMGIAALTALPLLLAIGLQPRRRPRFGLAIGLGAPAAILAVFTAMLFVRGGEGARGVPYAFPPLAYTLLLGAERAIMPSAEPRAVAMRTGAPRANGDVVLLIDESIAPTYLDLIDPAGVRSGLKSPPAGVAVHSFGIGAAITHCSLGSNLTLRNGGTRTDYQTRNEAGPTIWQYAKAAGYRTVYLDAQRTDGAFQNGMDEAEAAEIDDFVQFGGVDVIHRDHTLAERLSTYLTDDTRDLIVVNKIGAHFPVQAKYPESAAHYRPVADRSGFAGIVDTASRAGFADTAESWRRYRNAYRNTIEWNVGGFFDRLFGGGIGDATILYTADHGQDLNERTRPGNATHCSGNPRAAEGAVPMLVLTGHGAGGSDWQTTANLNANRTSHYQLFPTLLALMGFPASEIAATYGPDLTAPLKDEMRFNTLYNARLGRDPEWLAVTPAELPRPPASDIETGLAAR